jgi:hypothetical protein
MPPEYNSEHTETHITWQWRPIRYAFLEHAVYS